MCSSTTSKEMHVTDTGEELCFRDLCQINSGESRKIHTIYRREIKLPLHDRKHQTDIDNKNYFSSIWIRFPSSLGSCKDFIDH